MVDSSSPAISTCGGGGPTAAAAEFWADLLLTIHVKQAMQIEHTTAGMTMDNEIILKTCRPRDLPVDQRHC